MSLIYLCFFRRVCEENAKSQIIRGSHKRYLTFKIIGEIPTSREFKEICSYVHLSIQYVLPIIYMYGLYNGIQCAKMNCRRFGLSTFWFVDGFGLSTFWFVDVSVCRRFGLSTFCFVDVAVCRRFGLSTFWVSTFRFVDVWHWHQIMWQYLIKHTWPHILGHSWDKGWDRKFHPHTNIL